MTSLVEPVDHHDHDHDSASSRPSPALTMTATVKVTRHPVLTKQVTQLVEGIETQVLAQAYADTILILITQLGKVGYLCQVSMPAPFLSSTATTSAPGLVPPPLWSPPSPEHHLPTLPVPPAHLNVTPILGMAPDVEYDVYASQVATIVFYGLGIRTAQAKTKAIDTEERDNEEEEDDDDDQVQKRGTPRQVIVGIAFRQASPTIVNPRTRFGSIMSMVLQGRAW